MAEARHNRRDHKKERKKEIEKLKTEINSERELAQHKIFLKD